MLAQRVLCVMIVIVALGTAVCATLGGQEAFAAAGDVADAAGADANADASASVPEPSAPETPTPQPSPVKPAPAPGSGSGSCKEFRQAEAACRAEMREMISEEKLESFMDVARLVLSLAGGRGTASASQGQSCKSANSTLKGAERAGRAAVDACDRAITACVKRCDSRTRARCEALHSRVDRMERQLDVFGNVRSQVVSCLQVLGLDDDDDSDSPAGSGPSPDPVADQPTGPHLPGGGSPPGGPTGVPPGAGSAPAYGSQPLDRGDDGFSGGSRLAPSAGGTDGNGGFGGGAGPGRGYPAQADASSRGASEGEADGQVNPLSLNPINRNARVGAMAKPQGKFKVGTIIVDEGGGSPAPEPVVAQSPLEPPASLLRRRPQDRGPASVKNPKGVEALYCRQAEDAAAAPICQNAHKAICSDGHPQRIDGQRLGTVLERLRLARRTFFDTTTSALRQVMGPDGPPEAEPASFTPRMKDGYVRDYAVQAAIEIERVARRTPPEPPEANRQLMQIFLLNYWNGSVFFFPAATDVHARVHEARALLERAIATSELGESERLGLKARLAKTKIIAHDVKMRPASGVDGEHLLAYVETCGLLPLHFRATYFDLTGTLGVCPSVLGESDAQAPAMLLSLAHELGHSLAGDREPHSRYLACLQTRPSSVLEPALTPAPAADSMAGAAPDRAKTASAKVESTLQESETIADLWMTRAMAISTSPLFISAHTPSATRYLRFTMGGMCANTDAGGGRSPASDESTRLPAAFRLGEVFGRDPWVRWNLGCVNLCKPDTVCTLKGEKPAGEEKPK